MEINHTAAEVRITRFVIEIDLSTTYIVDKINTLSGESMLLWDMECDEWAIIHKFLDFSEDGESMLFEECKKPFVTKDKRDAMSKWLDYCERWAQ